MCPEVPYKAFGGWRQLQPHENVSLRFWYQTFFQFSKISTEYSQKEIDKIDKMETKRVFATTKGRMGQVIKPSFARQRVTEEREILVKQVVCYRGLA